MKSSLQPIEAMESKPDKEDIPDHEVESAMQTMLRAEEHKANPKMMKLVGAKLDKHKKAIKSIQGLKQRKAELQAASEDAPSDVTGPGKSSGM